MYPGTVARLRRMGRHRERGNAALAVIGALAISAGVGVGVYVAIKNQRQASADAADSVVTPPAKTAPPPEPTPTPEPEAPVAPPDPPAAPPADKAESTAIEPSGDEMIGTAGIDGELESNAVGLTIGTAAQKLARCEVALGGAIRVTLQVNRRGGVDSATAAGSDEALGTCAAKVLQQLRFPRTRDGNPAKVVVPLAFKQASAPCDEVSCVLDNYTGACCAQFRRGRGPRNPDESPDTASLQTSPPVDEIRSALTPDRRAVSSCAVEANFEGVLKVRIKIDPAGKVTEVTIADQEQALVSCVARVMKKHTFSRSQNGATVSFPYRVPL